MPSLRSVAVSLSVASPIKSRGAFTLKQVHMGYFAKSPVKDMAATYAKFGGTMPIELAQAVATSNTGSAPTHPGDAYDSVYLTPLDVGDPSMMLAFHTGSARLWVFSRQLPPS